LLEVSLLFVVVVDVVPPQLASRPIELTQTASDTTRKKVGGEE